MALSLTNALLPFRHNSPLPRRNSEFVRKKSTDFAPKKPTTTTTRAISSKTTDSSSPPPSSSSPSLSSILSELEKAEPPIPESETNAPNTKHQQDQRELADVWQEIQGQDDWADLLDPMDPLLRSELIRYGEMAQACYDAFDYDPFSQYCGSCRFIRRRFFEELGMSDRGYEVTRYLYATANLNLPNFFKQSRWQKMWSNKANWMGYVAVSNDETTKRLGRRDISISWRGTVTRLEWISDLMDFLQPVKDSQSKIPCPDPSVKVEYGFLDLYTDKDPNCRFCKYSAREQILAEVKRLTELYSDEELSITITGHSLGSALAMLNAYDLAETGLHIMGDGRALPITVFSYSGPRVGNARFKERIELLGVKVLRVVNTHDIVPRSPGFIFNENVPRFISKIGETILPWCYSHIGVELELNHEHSPFLKQTKDPGNAHNLEALLHLLDGYHGKGHRFVLASGRDPALVNKAADFLNDHHLVPPNWRQDENKGMIRNHDGRWMQPERTHADLDHPHDMAYLLKKLGL